jgi:hypothetical protein
MGDVRPTCAACAKESVFNLTWIVMVRHGAVDDWWRLIGVS